MKITLLFSELMTDSSLPLVNGIYLTLQCSKNIYTLLNGKLLHCRRRNNS